MSRTARFHKDPNQYRGTECTNDECGEEMHHEIEVLGKAGTAVFDCEHKSHTFVFSELTPVDPVRSGLNLTACDHSEEDCLRCSHKHSNGCIGKKWTFACGKDHDHTDDCPIKEIQGIACGNAPHQTRGKCPEMKHSGDKVPS